MTFQVSAYFLIIRTRYTITMEGLELADKLGTTADILDSGMTSEQTALDNKDDDDDDDDDVMWAWQLVVVYKFNDVLLVTLLCFYDSVNNSLFP